jgi:choline dehydrogenase-like flavoprotein
MVCDLLQETGLRRRVEGLPEGKCFVMLASRLLLLNLVIPLLTEHQTSSARMGSSAFSSVVDGNLNVHGVQSLRVVDASAFPAQVSGHPCAVVIAVAERAADLIRRGR